MPVSLLFLLAAQAAVPSLSQQLDAQTYPQMAAAEPYASYDAREKAYWQTRDALVLKLYAADPDNPRVSQILPMCWVQLGQATAQAQARHLLQSKPPMAVEDIARSTVDLYALKSLPATHTDSQVMAIWEDMSSHCLYGAHAPDVLFACSQELTSKVNRTREYRILAQLYPGFRRLSEVVADLKDWSGHPNFELDFKEVCTQKPDSICSKRGHVILVYFSPNGTPPQSIRDLYVRYHPSGLEAIGIAGTNTPEKMPWPLVADANDGVRKSWGVEETPTVFLVDKEGCLAYANPVDLESHVRELMAQR